MNQRLADLTETQILQEIRKHFEHEALTGIPTEQLIESSATLEELLAAIRSALAKRDAKSL